MSGDWIEAEADDEALRQAHAVLGGTQHFELWERKRLIRRSNGGSR